MKTHSAFHAAIVPADRYFSQQFGTNNERNEPHISAASINPRRFLAFPLLFNLIHRSSEIKELGDSPLFYYEIPLTPIKAHVIP